MGGSRHCEQSAFSKWIQINEASAFFLLTLFVLSWRKVCCLYAALSGSELLLEPCFVPAQFWIPDREFCRDACSADIAAQEAVASCLSLEREYSIPTLQVGICMRYWYSRLYFVFILLCKCLAPVPWDSSVFPPQLSFSMVLTHRSGFLSWAVLLMAIEGLGTNQAHELAEGRDLLSAEASVWMCCTFL